MLPLDLTFVLKVRINSIIPNSSETVELRSIFRKLTSRVSTVQKNYNPNDDLDKWEYEI